MDARMKAAEAEAKRRERKEVARMAAKVRPAGEVATNSLAFKMGAMELADKRRAESALVKKEDAPQDLVQRVKYDGRLVPFGEYVELQKALALELANKSQGRVPRDYWRRFEIVKLPNGKFRALARKEILEEFENEDGSMSAKKVAAFSYSGNVGINARSPKAKYNDESRLVAAGDDGNAPEVGEVQAWATV